MKRAKKGSFTNNTLKLDEFNVVLMKCIDYTILRNGNYYDLLPPIPTGAQTIYCEKDVSNGNFERISVSFTAASDYDVLWIFPKQWTWAADQWWIEVTKPELINVTNFSAGIAPNPVPPNCTVTIGPTTPNCGFENAIFTWYGPNGQVITAPANQQIQVNTANTTNVGTWTLKMTVPNVVTTNNTCSLNPDIQATVNVPACQSCNPVISPAGPIDIYYLYDGGGSVTLNSSSSNNNQWYKNGVLISGAPNQTYTVNVVGYLTKTDYYTVSASSCISNSVQVFSKGCIYNNEYPVPIPTSVTLSNPFTQSEQLDLGVGANYSWKVVPSTVCGIFQSCNPNIRFCQLDMSTCTSNGSGLNYKTKADNNGREVLMFPPSVTYYTSKMIFDTKSFFVYPNPTTNQITISSTETIKSIEISDLMNPVLKRIKVNNTKPILINVLDLKPGIYNCKITTDKGIENQKIIIQR